MRHLEIFSNSVMHVAYHDFFPFRFCQKQNSLFPQAKQLWNIIPRKKMQIMIEKIEPGESLTVSQWATIIIISSSALPQF